MPLRAGILGAGNMGRTHARVLALDPRVEIVGVADADAGSAERLAAEVSARPHADLDELLAAGIDLLIVATPNRFHAEAAARALESGIGVLCEKPMATTLEHARAVQELAERPGAFFVVGHNRRHAPVYRRVREILDEGFRPLVANIKMHEGDYRSPAWVANREISGGFLYENLVHFFDLMEWFMGPLSEVSCLARGPFYADLNDFVVAAAFEGGAIAALTATGHASWMHPAERTELVGDHTAMVVEGLDRVLLAPGEGRDVRIHDVSQLPRDERWGYREQDAEVVDALLERRNTCFSVRRALRTLEIADACMEAARQGRPVRLPPPPKE
jgi:predicted dehydrogenase